MSFEQAESNYTELVEAALKYGDAGAWARLRTADMSVKELQQYAESIGYHVNVNSAGQVISYTKDVTAPISSGAADVGSIIDSNLQGGTSVGSANTVYQTISDVIPDVAEGAEATAESTVKATGGMTEFVNGVKTALNTEVTPQIGKTVVAGKVLPAVIAASTGIKLGKGIDSAIYNIGKAMGADESKVWSFNPENWSNITEDMSNTGAEGVAKWAFNTLFGIDSKGNTTMYADENAFSYMTSYLQSVLNWFDKGETTLTEKDEYAQKNFSKYPTPIPINGTPAYYGNGDDDPSVYGTVNNEYIPENAEGEVYAIYCNESGRIYSPILVSNKPFSVKWKWYYDTNYRTGTPSHATINGKDCYWYGGGFSYKNPINYGNVYNVNFTPEGDALAYIIFNGKIVSTSGSPEGITDLNDANTPDLSGATTPSDALEILKKLYPELWDNRIDNQVVQPDGSVKTYTYVPLPFPISGIDQLINTDGATQTQQKVNPNPDTETDPQQKPATESQLWSLIQILTNSLTKPQGMTETEPETQPDGTPLNPDPPTNPPDTGTGEPPAVVPPTGSASSLWAIYNPTIPQINDFGAWLWSPNFVDQILKLFNDPMQSIIGLHRVYATPVTGETRTIKVGYLDSGVSSLIVTDQYSTVDCGTVNLREYFGNVLDYDPYTQVQLYLPFIGIVNLDVADVMRSSINIVYHVDVLTGACLAEVKVIRDSAGGTLYQYAGNAAVTMPISSGSYMGIVASIASIAGGVAGTIASGGAMAPMLLGSASSALGSARTKVEHSGGFSGNAGAMGIKKPYLIISRPQAALAKNYQNYIGDPSNTTTTLGSCTGYVQVKECHLENIPATQQELNNIEQILKGGVLL